MTAGAMTLIEVRPHRWGWKVFEAPGVKPVFPNKDHAITMLRAAHAFALGRFV